MLKFLIRIYCCFIFNKSKRRVIRKQLLNKVIEKQYCKSENNIIVPPQGLGDILYILLLLRERENKKYKIFLTKSHLGELCDLFPEVVDEKIYVDKLPWIPSAFYKYSDIYVKKYRKNFFQMFEKAVGVRFRKTKQFSLSSTGIEYFDKNGFVKGKTVLILPEANSCPQIEDMGYWIKYANELEKKGFVPVFNSLSSFGKYKSIFLSLKDTITFVDLAGFVIGYRSGLCDVLAYFTNAKQIYLYPDNPPDVHADYIKDWFQSNKAKKYLKFCSLKTFNNHKNIKEYVINVQSHPMW